MDQSSWQTFKHIWTHTFITHLNSNNIVMWENTAQQCRICLDAGLRMDGIPALDLGDWVIEVFQSAPNQTNSKIKYRETCRVIPHQTSTPKTKPRFQPSTTIFIWTMFIVCRRTRTFLDLVPCCTSLRITKPWLKWSSKAEVQQWDMYPEPTELLFDWLFDRIHLDPKILIKYVETKHQLADILTEGNFTRDEWNNLLHLFNITHFSSLCCAQNFSLTRCTRTMAKRIHEQEGDNRIVAKSKPTTMNLAVSVSTSSSTVNSPIASKSPGILKASCRADSSSSGELDVKWHNQDAASSSQGWQKRCTSGRKHRETCHRFTEYARRLTQGHLSFPGPGSEKKWCGTHAHKPDGEWDKTAEGMMLNFAESGHPVFRASSALERGALKSKGRGVKSIHFQR